MTIPLLLLAGLALPAYAGAKAPNDVIARVEDQVITLGEIDRMINSSNVVGMTIPPPGTAARNEARLTLLDKIISANLLYLDALRRKIDKNPVYQADVKRFADTTLATLYRARYLVGDIEVSDDEIMEYYRKNIGTDTPFTKDVGMSIEASLRKKKFKARMAALRARLRDGVEVSIESAQLAPAGDPDRKSGTVVARVDDTPLTWGEVRRSIAGPYVTKTLSARREALEKFIDDRLMIQKGRTAGLEQDPRYLARVSEFRKVRLINIHRAQLSDRMAPSDAEVLAYYERNRERIRVREMRKIQMVVLSTEAEAEQLKQAIDAGEMTIYQAATEHSIAPNARMNLGDFGWVSRGTGFPALDKLTFSLEKNKLGGPVQSPAGWHLVKVLDVRDARFNDASDPETLRKARRLLSHERRDAYVIALRKSDFSVEVYDDVIERLLKEDLERLRASEGAGNEALSVLQGPRQDTVEQ